MKSKGGAIALQYAVVRFRISTPLEWLELTAAEREVAALALRGLSNRDIAVRRGARERTVANQLASVFRKLGISSRSELAKALICPA